MVQEFTKFINENNKVQKPKINNKLIYELAIRDFYNDIKWMADEYNIDHFGEIYEQVLNNKSITSSTLGSKIRKTKVYNKIKFLAKKMGITPELKAFLNLFRIIKQIIINIAVLILRIFITLISIFKLIISFH